jgi:CheY-like chemotaxis protein
VDQAKALILVVDDDDDLRATLRRVLEIHGYAVIEAASGSAATLLLDVQSPDLIITDVFMPEGDGFEMMNLLRERQSLVPVIADSGAVRHDGIDFLHIAGHFGAVAVLGKPFHPRELIAAVAKGLEQREAN